MNTSVTETGKRPPSILETERLRLRRPRMEDAETIYNSYARDVEVTRYPSWTPHESLEETRDIIARFIESWKAGESWQYVIENKDSNAVMGMIGLGDDHAKASLGCVLAKPYWGNGYMTEAVKALIQWGLHPNRCQRMDAFRDIENDRSSRVSEKSGMSLEGALRRWHWHPQQDPEKLRDRKMHSIIN